MKKDKDCCKGSGVSKLVLGGITLLVLAAVIDSWDDIKRYMKMRSM